MREADWGIKLMVSHGYEKRLRGYDYCRGGAYFLTVCTKGREKLLGEVVESADGVLDVPPDGTAKVKLSAYGRILDETIRDFNRVYLNPRIIEYVIMPNHFHLLVVINPDLLPDGTGTSGTPSPQNATIPALMSTIKRFFNRRVGKNIWQRTYRDHIIRNKSDYNKICRYIEENPKNWKDDCYYT